MKNVDINSFFHLTGKGRVFCTIIGDLSKANKCIVYLAPLFEERLWSQRVAFNFAKLCWQKLGHPILIIDYYGYGESDGDTEDFSLSEFQTDLQELLIFIKKKYNIPTFSLWGIRTGAFLAQYFNQHTTALVDSLLLWAPVLDLQKYIYDQLRSTVVAQNVLFKTVKATRDTILKELFEVGQCKRGNYILNQIDGFRIGKLFWQELVNFDDMFDNLLSNDIPTYYLNIVPPKKKKIMSKPSTEQLSENQNVVLETIISKAFWLNNSDYAQSIDDVYDLSLAWLNKCYVA